MFFSVTFPLVSWVRCSTWLNRVLIFAPLLTLQPSRWERESWVLYFNCLIAAMWLMLLLLCDSSSWCRGLVCSVWLWNFVAIHLLVGCCLMLVFDWNHRGSTGGGGVFSSDYLWAKSLHICFTTVCSFDLTVPPSWYIAYVRKFPWEYYNFLALTTAESKEKIPPVAYIGMENSSWCNRGLTPMASAAVFHSVILFFIFIVCYCIMCVWGGGGALYWVFVFVV